MVEQIRKQNQPNDSIRVNCRTSGTFRIQRRHPIMDNGEIKRLVDMTQDVLFRHKFIHICYRRIIIDPGSPERK